MKKLFLGIAIAVLALTQGISQIRSCDYNAFDQDFRNNLLLSEANYTSEMENTVLPYLSSRNMEGYFSVEDDSKIHTRIFWPETEEQKGTIVIFHGYTEFEKKYDEMIYYFLKEGYSVLSFDHRSHGYSTRDLDNLSKVYITDFEIFVRDAHSVIHEATETFSLPQPMYLFAHSMGGAIGARYLEEYPEDFSKAVLSSPMLEINTGKYPEFLADFISGLMSKIGKGSDYIFGGKDFVPDAPVTLTEGDSLPRKEHTKMLRNSDKKYQTHSGTFRWLHEAFKFMKEIQEKENLKSIKTEILLFQAEKDDTVRPKGQNTFVKKLLEEKKKVEMVRFPGLNHTLWETEDQYLAPYYTEIFNFYGK